MTCGSIFTRSSSVLQSTILEVKGTWSDCYTAKSLIVPVYPHCPSKSHSIPKSPIHGFGVLETASQKYRKSSTNYDNSYYKMLPNTCK